MSAASHTDGWLDAKDARAQGFADYRKDVPWSRNPFPSDREERFEWFTGWAEAKRASQKRK